MPATYTCGSGGDYASVQTCVASGVLANGDTMQLVSGYSVDERVLPSNLDNITIVGDVANPGDYDVYYSNPATSYGYKVISLTNCQSWTFKGFKLRYTGTYTVSSGGMHGGYTANGGHVCEDLIVETTGFYGIAGMGTGSAYRRCSFLNNNAYASGGLPSAENGTLIGPDSPGANGTLIESCLVLNSTYYGIQAGTATSTTGPTIKNTTVYLDRTSGHGSSMGIATTGPNAQIRNCVVGMDVTVADGFVNNKPVSVNSDAATLTVSDSVLYGARWGDNSDLSGGGSSTTTNVVRSSGVSSSAVVFNDAAARDFSPFTGVGHLLFEKGDTTYAPALDIARTAFNSTPSIGAYEVAQLDCSLDYSGGGSASNRAGAWIKSSKTFTKTASEYSDSWAPCLVSENNANGNPGWKITAESLGHIIAGYPYRLQVLLDNGASSSSRPQMHLKLRNTAKAMPLHCSSVAMTNSTRVWVLDLEGGIDPANADNIYNCALITDIECIYVVYDWSVGAPVVGANATLTVTSTLPRR